MEVEPEPESLIVSYSDAFCRRNEEILAAVDRLILNDKVLGPVAVELAGRLMLQFGYDCTYLKKESREALINCLTLLIGGEKQPAKFAGAGTIEQDTEEDVT